MSISKATRVFESPLLCTWQFECSVHIFRGPCIDQTLNRTRKLKWQDILKWYFESIKWVANCWKFQCFQFWISRVFCFCKLSTGFLKKIVKTYLFKWWSTTSSSATLLEVSVFSVREFCWFVEFTEFSVSKSLRSNDCLIRDTR